MDTLIERIQKQRKVYEYWTKYGIWLGLGFGLVTRLLVDVITWSDQSFDFSSPVWWVKKVSFVLVAGMFFAWMMKRQAKDALNKLELMEKNNDTK